MANSTADLRQSAAIPLRNGQVCMVTSRSGKRWVVPKGCLEPGKTAGEIALQEAWEEAGLVGLLAPDPVGSYIYEKAGVTCHVLVYLMQVTQVAEDWAERQMRERTWLALGEAILRTEEPGLREILRALLDRNVG
jgi:8-oxo-dGTP pyrophosphatase MutT (NUDIX family)